MNKRSQAVRVIVSIVFLLIAAGCTSASGHDSRTGTVAHRDPRPNIVFVLTDDLSTDLVQYMPHVRALEEAGTSFSHYFVVDSLCCPSRSAIFTGQYPHDNGVYTNHGSVDGGYHTFTRRGDDKHTFAVALHDAGYRTGFMGKYLNEYQPVDHKPVGWDDWVAAGKGYPEYNYVLNDNGSLHRYGHAPEDYLTDVLSAKADSFIQDAAHQRKPFALEVATFAPHRPSTPAPQDLGSFPTLLAPRGPAWDRPPVDAPAWLAGFPALSPADIHQIDTWYRLRVESVQAVDRMVGRLQQRLERTGLLKNTYFVFSSDNGYHMGQYRLLPGKQTAFDTDIRVPLVVTGPGVGANRVVNSVTSSIDLAPTFAAIGDTHMAGPPDGTSLLPVLGSGVAPPGWQNAALIEHHGPDFDEHDPDAQPLRAANPPSYEAVRTTSSLYVEYADGERELYDLTSDPDELNNIIASAPPDRVATLRDTLHRLELCHDASECQAAARVS